ncbi:uncharacterized protein [Eurosta solidaginis]|uniref:uncharacterized protein n=1 Tax=Eurosta solidaginis TaxID=178769 RepID=UPI003530DE1F
MSITGESFSDDEDFKKLTQANFRKIRNKSAKIGYADGVSNGQEETFQSAFDMGYVDGLRTGFEFEKYQAFYNSSSTVEIQDEGLNQEKSLFINMAMPSATDESHRRFFEYEKETPSTISGHQKNYVDNFLQQCQRTLPLTTSLLATKNSVE